MSKNDHDVIVIGAGHNGLTAAAYLQRAGLRTIVLEASPTSGGMLGTNPIFASAPNHLVNEGGIQASLFRSATVESDLELQRYGLRQIIADPFHVHLDPTDPRSPSGRTRRRPRTRCGTSRNATPASTSSSPSSSTPPWIL